MSYEHWYYNSKSEEDEARFLEQCRAEQEKINNEKRENWNSFHSCLETNPYK